MDEITTLIDNYYAWLKEKTIYENVKINGKPSQKWLEITAPYLDRNNDYIQIYLKQVDGGFLLTDDGATILGLEQGGCSLDSPKRQKILTVALNGYGVQQNNGRLQIKANQDNFPERKHSLIQAILAVSDMFYLATPHVTSLFLEDVQAWLDSVDIRYSPQVAFKGKSGYTRHFDFVIPKSREAPERMLKTINNPTRNSAESIIMDWIDTKEKRQENSKAFAFLNNDNRKISKSLFPALRNYEIEPIPWSERESYIKELAA